MEIWGSFWGGVVCVEMKRKSEIRLEESWGGSILECVKVLRGSVWCVGGVEKEGRVIMLEGFGEVEK